ncbi:LysM peptidoglycan-binding domain-containing protein [Bacillus aquiflavi]|uniref:M14 family metallopeptidase n=1 Tax=Bacillus aquiflavi TaxID=2672567 RepID=UPI001CA9E897|nr:M14 family zinc carboxypeptidase [Bacillus aquiflavi]UAC47242.1 LysM peptidoglycan-binding domain-containing protein [Bacillus aquiflavi]
MKVKIRSGDTFWYYSQLFLVNVQLIIDSNPNLKSSSLPVGQEVNIPGFITQQYTIKRGDTFWKLAAARHISVDALLLLNQTKNPNLLKPGDIILLPKRVTYFVVNGKIEYNSTKLQEDLVKLKEIYPFITERSVGTSVLGKPLHVIKIGKGPKKVQINASFHANEWITTPILMRLVNEYVRSQTNNYPIRGLNPLPLYHQVELTIVPMVNPDGVDLILNGPPSKMKDEVIKINKGSTDFSGWKANIRGVDLNNQYPANWDIEKKRKEPKQPAPRDYPGDAPLTEPEAKAMADLARSGRFDKMLAFHTQGKEFYWGYEGFEPPQSKVIATEFERVSGYRAIQYVDSHAGYKDWFIQEFRKPGFTIELGKGVNPLPLSQFDEIYQEVLGIFLASLYM